MAVRLAGAGALRGFGRREVAAPVPAAAHRTQPSLSVGSWKGDLGLLSGCRRSRNGVIRTCLLNGSLTDKRRVR